MVNSWKARWGQPLTSSSLISSALGPSRADGGPDHSAAGALVVPWSQSQSQSQSTDPDPDPDPDPGPAIGRDLLVEFEEQPFGRRIRRGTETCTSRLYLVRCEAWTAKRPCREQPARLDGCIDRETGAARAGNTK